MSAKSAFCINNHTPLLGYRISIIPIRYPTIRFDLIDKLKMSIYRFVDYRWYPYQQASWSSEEHDWRFLSRSTIFLQRPNHGWRLLGSLIRDVQMVWSSPRPLIWYGALSHDVITWVCSRAWPAVNGSNEATKLIPYSNVIKVLIYSTYIRGVNMNIITSLELSNQ